MSAEYTRAYAPYGRIAHLLMIGASAAYPATLCGRTPRLFTSWLGTGSQGEYEKAAALPLCKRCEKAAGGAA